MLALCLSLAVVILDQLTKHAVRSHLNFNQPITVIPGFFDLRYIRNTGAAWGILEGLNQWLVVLSVAMLLAIVIFRRHLFHPSAGSQVAIGLMVGGIAGNLIDRIRLNYVVDFLDFYWGRWHFPAFNVADAAICCGVGLYMLLQLVVSSRVEQDERGASTS